MIVNEYTWFNLETKDIQIYLMHSLSIHMLFLECAPNMDWEFPCNRT